MSFPTVSNNDAGDTATDTVSAQAIRLLGDAEVRDRVVASEAVALMREALRDSFAGQLVSPARLSVDAGPATLTLTVGGMRGGVTGFRVYGSWGPAGDQLTPVWNREGRLIGIITGSELGTLRTGALGGAAIDVLARADSTTLGVIGTGRIAWSQVWAAFAARQFTHVDVFSPNPEHRHAFARRIRRTFGVDSVAASTAQQAVGEHDVVIVSTVSPSPVLDASWIAPGTHINSTGPKSATASELGSDLAELADVLVSDSPQQAAASPEGWFSARRVEHLGGVIAGHIPGRAADSDVTLYCSTGLAGTEVLLAAALLR